VQLLNWGWRREEEVPQPAGWMMWSWTQVRGLLVGPVSLVALMGDLQRCWLGVLLVDQLERRLTGWEVLTGREVQWILVEETLLGHPVEGILEAVQGGCFDLV